LRDQVEDGTNGFLFPQGDIAAQADLMRRLAADPELRSRLGATAREMARHFDAHLMAQTLEEEILDLIAFRKRDGTDGR
jgi:glycosyltransferase involved in cell wall biosynthesis